MGIMDIVKGKRKGKPQRVKTLYTTDIIRAVARKQRYSQRTVAAILSSVVGEVEATVAQGNTVQLTNFGTFYSVLRKPSKGRNLRTNAVIDIPQMYLARFRPGAALKQSVRGKSDSEEVHNTRSYLRSHEQELAYTTRGYIMRKDTVMSEETLKVGDPAPGFELPSDTGETVKLADFRGKRVVVFFYPKDDTPGCTTQACGFRDNYLQIEEKNATVLGISPDGVTSHQKFKTKFNLPFILLADEDHAVAEAYGAWGEKTNYGKTYMGIIRSHFVIDEAGKIADAQVNVSPTASVERALAALG